MTLAVVATFSDLQEAHIAAGALRSCAFEAVVLDAEIGSSYWFLQPAMGGFRLAVPPEQHAQASALLRDIREKAPRSRSLSTARMWDWRLPALSLAFVDPGLGFVSAPRRRRLFRHWPALLAAGGIILALVLVARMLPDFFYRWLIDPP